MGSGSMFAGLQSIGAAGMGALSYVGLGGVGAAISTG